MARVAVLAAIAWQRLVGVRTGARTVSVKLVSLVCCVEFRRGARWPLAVARFCRFVAVGAGRPVCIARRGDCACWPPSVVIALAPIALVLLTMLDLGSYGLSYAVLPGTERLDVFAHDPNAPPSADRPIVAQPIDESSPAADLASTQPDGLRVGNRLLLAGFRRADGYAGLVPRRQLDFADPLALRVAGVGYRAESIGDEETIRWVPVADPLAADPAGHAGLCRSWRPVSGRSGGGRCRAGRRAARFARRFAGPADRSRSSGPAISP